MLVRALSDIHGRLPDDIAACDLLVIAGDICPVHNHSTDYQAWWLRHLFRSWLKRVPAKHIVAVAGNHDFVFLDLRPKLPWVYLQDEGVEIEGREIYGTPWTPADPEPAGWAFEAADTAERLGRVFSLIPKGLDLLITHTPPWGFGDLSLEGEGEGAASSPIIPDSGAPQHRLERAGSKQLLAAIARATPRVVASGHIHEGRGRWERGSTTLINASTLDANYQPYHEPPMYFEL
jgi:Icc-related predicted phosphoesterase